MTEPEKPEAAEGSLITHLLELRDRLLYAVIAIAVVFFALIPFAGDVYTLVAQPLMGVLPPGATMVATEVASPFLTPIKLTLAVAIVITIPFLLYQLWAFVAPGLYKHERRLVFPLLLSSTILFYGGMAFAYFVVFPMAFGFFVHALPPGVTMMTDIRSYMDFVFSMFFAFGIAFEVPIAVILLARMGVIDPETLAAETAVRDPVGLHRGRGHHAAGRVLAVFPGRADDHPVRGRSVRGALDETCRRRRRGQRPARPDRRRDRGRVQEA